MRTFARAVLPALLAVFGFATATGADTVPPFALVSLDGLTFHSDGRGDGLYPGTITLSGYVAWDNATRAIVNFNPPSTWLPPANSDMVAFTAAGWGGWIGGQTAAKEESAKGFIAPWAFRVRNTSMNTDGYMGFAGAHFLNSISTPEVNGRFFLEFGGYLDRIVVPFPVMTDAGCAFYTRNDCVLLPGKYPMTDDYYTATGPLGQDFNGPRSYALNGSQSITAIPEPSTFALLGAGLVVLSARLWRGRARD
jgi:hypothetical protein